VTITIPYDTNQCISNTPLGNMINNGMGQGYSKSTATNTLVT